MGKEILTFVDNAIKKSYCQKSSIFLKNVDIDKVLLTKNISSGKIYYKYFIGYLHIEKVMIGKLNECFFIENDD